MCEKDATQAILDIFYQLTTIPHGSHNTHEMALFLESFAKGHGYSVKKDSTNNILISKENAKPKVCFQCHYDMVCVGLAAQNLPMQLAHTKRTYKGIKQTWLKAKDSSLGADNGMGIAMMLAFMQQGIDAEFLFTNDEEVGMIGAKGLTLPIQSKILLNLDSEVLGEITIGCAGGFDLSYQSEFSTTELSPNWHYYIMQAQNFVGGHSGIDINNTSPHYQNAIIQSAHCLKKIAHKNNNAKLFIVNWKGGEKRNSIPMHSKLIIASKEELHIESNEFFVFKALKEQQNELLDKTNEIFLQTPSGIEFSILYELLMDLQIGVLAPFGECVQNSRSLSHISFANGRLELAFMGRANTNALLQENLHTLKEILKKVRKKQNTEKLKIEVGEYYAPWEKQDASIDHSLCKIAKDSIHNVAMPHTPKEVVISLCASMYKYLESFLIEPEIVTLHAGLECGILLQRFQDMGLHDITALSIGPTINSPHSIHEEVWVESAGALFLILQDFMAKLTHEG